MKWIIVLLVIIPYLSFSQIREDDPLPRIKTINTISNITGWTKTDIGKWVSASNALPKYDNAYRVFMPYDERVLKFELARIDFDSKPYYCLAKFTKHIYGYRNEKLEFVTEYWFFDLANTKKDSLKNNVDLLIYNTVVKNHVFNYKPVVWQDIIKDIKIEVDKRKEEYRKDLFIPEFTIQKRLDSKTNKYQFLFCSTTESLYPNSLEKMMLEREKDGNLSEEEKMLIRSEEERKIEGFDYHPSSAPIEKIHGLRSVYYETGKDALLVFLKPILPM